MVTRTASHVSKGKSIRCSKGYKFKSLGRNKVALMRNNNHGATFTYQYDTYTGGSTSIPVSTR